MPLLQIFAAEEERSYGGLLTAVFGIMETSEDEAGQAFSQVLPRQGGTPQAITMERIDSRDSKGNWSQKTILACNPESQDHQPRAVVHRTITYP